MAHSEGGILFHCQEGKDRTGIISALLLLLGGAEDIDIIADYEISNAYLYEMTKTAKTIPGGIPDFLLKKGVLQIEIEMLKRKLLE